jgi:prepilin-type N-terminal cleavage/methylation domain-containing protein
MNARRQADEKRGKQGRRGMTLVEVLVALFVSGLAVAGIVSGYMFANTSAEKFGLSLAATSQASQYLERMRSAKWDVSVYPPIDQLVATNFPTTVVTLEAPAQGTNIVYATNFASISTISTNPPLRRLRVDSVWRFRGIQLLTNTVETCRAPDQ